MTDQLVLFLTAPDGDPVVRTPNLDRLAARGGIFDAASTPYPLCAPARVALLTGERASSFRCHRSRPMHGASLVPLLSSTRSRWRRQPRPRCVAGP